MVVFVLVLCYHNSMLRRSLITLIVFFGLIFSLVFTSSLFAQTINLTQEKVVYDLPYPGMTPDSPLYIFKNIRDRVTILLTRDDVKKAHLYLLLSDKRMAMALLLSKTGKNTLTVSTLSKGEKYFVQIPPLLAAAKKQGNSATPEFINKLKVSNAKHREVIESLLQELPQGETAIMNDILKLNQEIRLQLERL